MVNDPAHGDRCLALSGASNFRDLGGYPAGDLRLVRKGRIFRSDHLSRLTPGDLQLLAQKRFRLVCDLRTIREQQLAPDRLPASGGTRLLRLPVEARGFDPSTAMDRLQRGDDSWLSLDFFIDLYRSYLDDFAPVWARVISLAASPNNHPLVFHCTGGKDRTGICAALLLGVLGVEEENIFYDYDLTNICNGERLHPIYASFAELGVEPERAAPYLQAPAKLLVAFFDHLKKRYRTVEDYLIGTAGLKEATIEALRATLLR